ncbi:MAG: class I SAM-dependent methyltransferase [Candidatus Babeliales bacterium]
MDAPQVSYGTLCALFYDITKQYASQQEVDFYAAYAPHTQVRILECMSGSGRLQIPLLQQGYQVDGVDNSPAMLARCRQRCASLDLQPLLFEQSIHTMQLLHTYDMIIIAAGSLQLLTDPDVMRAALKNMRAHMRTGGDLLLNLFIPDVTVDVHETLTAPVDEHTSVRLTKRHFFDVAAQQADTHCLYELISSGVIRSQQTEWISVVWYTDAQIKTLLEQAGFQIVACEQSVYFGGTEYESMVHAQAI